MFFYALSFFHIGKWSVTCWVSYAYPTMLAWFIYLLHGPLPVILLSLWLPSSFVPQWQISTSHLRLSLWFSVQDVSPFHLLPIYRLINSLLTNQKIKENKDVTKYWFNKCLVLMTIPKSRIKPNFLVPNLAFKYPVHKIIYSVFNF